MRTPPGLLVQTTSRSVIVPVPDVASTRMFPPVPGQVVVPPAPSGQLMALSALTLFEITEREGVPATSPS